MTDHTPNRLARSAVTAILSSLVLAGASSCRTPAADGEADAAEVAEVAVATFTEQKAVLFRQLVEERSRLRADAAVLGRFAEEAAVRVRSMPDGDEKEAATARQAAFSSEAAEKISLANRLSQRLESEFGVKPDARYRFEASTGVLWELVPADVLAAREESARAAREREAFARAAEALAGRRAAEKAAKEEAIQGARTRANNARDDILKARLRAQTAEKEREKARNAAIEAKKRLSEIRDSFEEASAQRRRLEREANQNRREAQRTGRRLERLVDSDDFAARLEAGRAAAMARAEANASDKAFKRAEEDEETLREALNHAEETEKSARAAVKEAEKAVSSAAGDLRRAEKADEAARRALSEIETEHQK